MAMYWMDLRRSYEVMSDMAGDCLCKISALFGVIWQAQAGLFGYNEVLMASRLCILLFGLGVHQDMGFRADRKSVV